MRHLGQPPPLHPLVAFVNYDEISHQVIEKGTRISLDFYKISFKNSFHGQIKYGQGHYDFEDGGLAFLKPRQIVTASADSASYEGCVLYFHPDFIRNSPLGHAINKYGFFSYAVSEALCLSAKEKFVINNIFGIIAAELENSIDQFSEDVLITQITLLLNYSSRFYNRQFITRKMVSHEIIVSLDRLLEQHFAEEAGLPSVQYVSKRLQLSARYLSDMLRSLTGYTAQQYIQNKVIEQSKDLLSTTSLSVAEIAYKLGFEHPQSFSKLFKIKTNSSPLAFRQSFS